MKIKKTESGILIPEEAPTKHPEYKPREKSTLLAQFPLPWKVGWCHESMAEITAANGQGFTIEGGWCVADDVAIALCNMVNALHGECGWK